jgi:hypothetical protein
VVSREIDNLWKSRSGQNSEKNGSQESDPEKTSHESYCAEKRLQRSRISIIPHPCNGGQVPEVLMKPKRERIE